MSCRPRVGMRSSFLSRWKPSRQVSVWTGHRKKDSLAVIEVLFWQRLDLESLLNLPHHRVPREVAARRRPPLVATTTSPKAVSRTVASISRSLGTVVSRMYGSNGLLLRIQHHVTPKVLVTLRCLALHINKKWNIHKPTLSAQSTHRSLLTFDPRHISYPPLLPGPHVTSDKTWTSVHTKQQYQ